MEHLSSSIIPPGLAKRWKEFAEAVRVSWKKVHRLGLEGSEALEKFWSIMETEASAGVHLMSIAEAKKYGVKPHPIAVLVSMNKGLSREEAEKEAIEKGKFHGVSLLRAEIEREKGLTKMSSEEELGIYREFFKEFEGIALP